MEKYKKYSLPVFSVCIVILAACVFFWHNDRNSIKIKEVYNGLRQLPFDTGTMETEDQINSVIDIRLKGKTDEYFTINCYFDGGVTLLYSKGGGYFGMGIKNPDIEKASLDFLSYSLPLLGDMERVEKSDSPDTADIAFFIITKDGIYKKEFRTSGDYGGGVNALLQKCEKLIDLVMNTTDLTD